MLRALSHTLDGICWCEATRDDGLTTANMTSLTGPSAWQQNADTNLHNSTHLLNAEPIGAIPLMMRAAYEYSWVDSGLCVEFCSCRLAMVSYPSLAAVS